MTAAILTWGLSKRYGEVLAVDAVDLSVDRGEVYGFLGLSRAGRPRIALPSAYGSRTMTLFIAARWAEALTACRSKVPCLTALGFSLAPLMGGLFMLILKNPERARSMGLISATAQLAAGVADWPTFFGLLAQATAVGGAIQKAHGAQMRTIGESPHAQSSSSSLGHEGLVWSRRPATAAAPMVDHHSSCSIMGLSIHDLLSRRTDAGFFGRADELAALGRLLEDSGPIVLHLHGIGGIGKTCLPETFAAQAQAGDAVVVRLDCRAIEPTERSFLTELCALLGAPAPTLTAVAKRLGALGHRVVLALDTYEVFRLLDAWLRQVFIPSLDAHVRILLIGREPPALAWPIAPGWQGLFRSLALGPLGEDDARALLLHAGLDELDARRINRFTHAIRWR
jgi:hypothetical protein